MRSICWGFRKLCGRSPLAEIGVARGSARRKWRSAPARIARPGAIAGSDGAGDRWSRASCRGRIPSLGPAMSADVDARQLRRCFRMNFLELGSPFLAVAAAIVGFGGGV